MTRDETVAAIKSRIRRTQNTTLDADIILEMRLTQTRLEQGVILPWFLSVDNATLLTSTMVNFISAPVEFLRFEDDDCVFLRELVTDKWSPIPVKHQGYLGEKYGNETGGPSECALNNDKVVFAPAPDKVFFARMRYFAKDAELTSNIENGWLKNFPDLVIAETALVIAGNYLRDDVMVAKFTADASREQTRLLVATEARRNAGRSDTMGND